MRWLLLKDLQILRRSKLLVSLLIIYPIAIATLMGFALSSGPDKPRVAFLNQVPENRETIQLGDQKLNIRAYTGELLKAIETVPVSSRAEALEKVRSGAVLAAMIIPSDFTQKLSTGGFSRASVEVVYNGDALKQSFVTSTITSKLAAANAALSGEVNRLATGYIDVLLNGGALNLFGEHFPILGLKRSSGRIDQTLADNATPANQRRLQPVQDFAHLALANADRATDVLDTVQKPVNVQQTVLSGRRTPLDTFAVAVAVTVSLMFVCVLLASGLLALEREENTFARLARGLVPGGWLLAEKVILAAACSFAVTLAMLLGVSAVRALGDEPDRSVAAGARRRRDRVRHAGRRDRLPGARGARRLAAGLRARAAARVPRPRAERRGVAGALRRHPRDLGGVSVQAGARGDGRGDQRLVAGDRAGAGPPRGARGAVRRGGVGGVAAICVTSARSPPARRDAPGGGQPP